MKEWIVATGDVDHGFTFYGPMTLEEIDELMHERKGELIPIKLRPVKDLVQELKGPTGCIGIID